MCKSNIHGNHQPYWYEDYVGLIYVVDLICNKTDIESVEFQSIITEKLDDIVVKYKDESIDCIQVKSTEIGEKNNIGFETIVTQHLPDWFKEWKQLREKNSVVRVILFSNRGISAEWPGSKKSGNYLRPKLDDFWNNVSKQLIDVESIDDIKMPKPDYNIAWNKWCDALGGKDEKQVLKLEFMKSFQLKLEQSNFCEIENDILNKMIHQYNIGKEQAEIFLNEMKAALSKWTTTDGKKKHGNCVTHETILRTLKKNRYLANKHYIPVNSNFFNSRKVYVENIIKEIDETDRKAMFLKGSPGSGKTTIVSYMAYLGKIDFRFYAFEPISVSNPRLGADNGLSKYIELWGDIYYQIYEYILSNYKKFADFKMIPYVEWMKEDTLQQEVLRLLGELAKKEERKIIVSIDGIDHAARSGDKKNFLDRFCTPSSIPNNVFFLIAGQPCYKEYPDWIVDQRYTIQKQVKNITVEDIKQLYDSSKIQYKGLQKDLIVKVIDEKVDGNTLSAVFAIKEAELCSDLEEFIRRMNNRELDYDIEKYYTNIWEYCIKEIDIKIRNSVAVKLGLILSLSITSINVIMLEDIFADHNIDRNNWHEILRRMKPLITEGQDGFYIEINDVKVFLRNKINVMYNQNDVEKNQIELAEYFFSKEIYIKERHFVVFNLLKNIKNEETFMLNFDVEYILEGLAIKQTLYNFKEQVEYVTNKAIFFKRWDILFSAYHSLMVLRQAKKTNEWNDIVYVNNKCNNMLLPSEVQRTIKNKECLDVVSILKDAEELFWNNKFDRAHALLQRYFGNISFKGLVKLFKNDEIDENDFGITNRDRMIRFGRVCRYCEYKLNIDIEIDKLSRNEMKFIESFNKGWLEASKDTDNVEINFTLESIIVLKEDFLIYLYALEEQGLFEELFSLCERCLEIEKLFTPIILQIGAWYIQKNRIDEFDRIIIPKIEKYDVLSDIEKIENSGSHNYKIKLLSICNWYFLIGFANKRMSVDERTIKSYYEYLEDNGKKLLKCLLELSYYYGIMYYKVNKGDCIFEEFREFLESLLSKDAMYIDNISTLEFIKDSLNKLINLGIYFDNTYGKIIFELFSNKLLNIASKEQWNSTFSKIICIYLGERGEKESVEEYLKIISDEKSLLWRISKLDRDYILREIEVCFKKLNIDEDYLKNLKNWANYFSVNYITDRENVLYDLLDWLNILLNNSPEKWSDYIYSVLLLSETIRKIASNEVGLEFEKCFTKAAIMVDNSELLRAFKYMNIRKDDAITVLTKCVSYAISNFRIDLDDIILLWEYLYKNTESDYWSQKVLVELKNEIILYLENNNNLAEFKKQFINIDKVQDKLNIGMENSIEETEKNYEEMYEIIKKQFEKKDPKWDVCIDFIKYLKEYRPGTMKKDIDLILDLIFSKWKMRSFRYSDLYNLYDILFEITDNTDKWRVVEYHMLKLNSDDSLSNWLEYTHDNLFSFLTIKYKKIDTDKMKEQIDLIIDMHKRILSGNYRYAYPCIEADKYIECEDVENWSDFIEKFENICTNDK